MVDIVPIRLGDVVALKRSHACGGNEWEVTKLGLDIGLRCLSCDHKVRLLRSRFDRRFTGYIRRAQEARVDE